MVNFRPSIIESKKKKKTKMLSIESVPSAGDELHLESRYGAEQSLPLTVPNPGLISF